MRVIEPLFEIDVVLPPPGSRDISRALHDELRSAIIEGRLAAGAKLPPTRKSAKFFGVSRNTAAEAYARLETEGYAITRHSSGTYVASKISPPPRLKSKGNDAPHPTLSTFWRRADIQSAMNFWRDRTKRPFPPSNAPPVDFRPTSVDSLLFPFDVFRKASAVQLRRMEKSPGSFKSPQGNQGNYYLRDAIAKHTSLTRGIACDVEDIVVTSGAQQAFDLLARVLVTRNETVVAIEDPGYPPMRVAFLSATALGMLYSLSLLRTGTIWFAIGVHAAFDFSETFLFSPSGGLGVTGHLLDSSLQGPAWLTGGVAGPEASVNGVLVFALLFLIVNRLRGANVEAGPTKITGPA